MVEEQKKDDSKETSSSAEAAEEKEKKEVSQETPKNEEKTVEKTEKKVEESPEEKKEEVEVPKKFKKIVEEIEKMSVLDLAELVKILEKKFGVSAASQVVAAPAAETASGAAAEEEKTEFTIELQAIGDKKIEVIKAVRDITQKGLKEAKDLVDSAATSPQVVKENVKKEEAEEIKKKLEAAGAKVELK